MPALIEHGHELGVLVIFTPKSLQSIQNVRVIVHADNAVNYVVCLLLLHCWIHLINLVKPKADLHVYGQ